MGSFPGPHEVVEGAMQNRKPSLKRDARRMLCL